MTALPWSTPVRRAQAPDPITPTVRNIVRARSGGLCELGCGERATHMHHRQLRRFGDHQPANLLHTCGKCHRRLHDRVRYSQDAGWLVSSHDNPRERPVLIHGEPFLLDDEGGKS